VRLREDQIEIAPAPARGTFDELNVFRAKDHAAEDTQKFGHSANGTAINGEVAFPGRPENLYLVIPGVMGFPTDEKSFLPVAKHLRACDSAKGAQSREQINRFENVGFALCVVAQKEVEAGRELDVEPPVVPKIP
jgi:hypothetical protein